MMVHAGARLTTQWFFFVRTQWVYTHWRRTKMNWDGDGDGENSIEPYPYY